MLRIKIVFTFFVILITVIVGKLFYIQVLSSDSFSSNNYLLTSRIEPVRGTIVDRNGEPLALNQSKYTLYAEPKNIEHPYEIIKKIDEVLQIGEATLEARLDMSKVWVPLDRNVTREQKDLIDKEKLLGLGFDEESKRFYPEASSAAHILGFVGKDSEGDDIGYFGVEGYYDRDLSGLPGILKSERDILGRPIAIGTQDRLKGENGRKLVLTIDKTTQNIAKKKLRDAIDTYKAKSGCVTIADPNTGEILALTCLPDFDPDSYGEFTQETLKNPVISDIFEPGSIFKPLVVAAALEEKAIKPETTVNEKGPVKIGKYYIKTWNDEYNGILTISEILQNSSNVGMVYIGEKLGNKKLLEYISDKFGFGEETGIDLQGEVPAPIRTKWYDVDYATATFGQGIAVTQIQMITAFSSIVNGGHLMKPYIVKEMISENGDVDEITPKEIRRVISEKTSNQVKEMLRETVEHGEVHWDVPKGYKIGGKTGTAQIAVQGTYDASKTNASYIGFVPYDKPQFIALVTLHQPETSPWASETAALLFFDIANELIVEYNIAPN